MVERGGEDDLGQIHLLVEQLFENGKSVQAGHLDVEEDDIRFERANQVDRFDPVGPLRQYLHTFSRLEQIQKLLARKRFVVDDEGSQGQGKSDKSTVVSGQKKQVTTHRNLPLITHNLPLIYESL